MVWVEHVIIGCMRHSFRCQNNAIRCNCVRALFLPVGRSQRAKPLPSSTRATLLHPPDRDALSGSARSCWGRTGSADWACSGRARSWSWTWACEPGGCGTPRPVENRRRPSSDERTRAGPEPAGKELERSWRPRSHRRSWCSRSPLLSGTGLTRCCVCVVEVCLADGGTEQWIR